MRDAARGSAMPGGTRAHSGADARRAGYAPAEARQEGSSYGAQTRRCYELHLAALTRQHAQPRQREEARRVKSATRSC